MRSHTNRIIRSAAKGVGTQPRRHRLQSSMQPLTQYVGKKFNVGDLVRSDEDNESYIIYRVLKKLTRNEYGYDILIKSVLVIDGSIPVGYDSTEVYSDNLIGVTLVELCMIRAKLDEFIQAEVKLKSGGHKDQEKANEPKTRHRASKNGKRKAEEIQAHR